VFVFITISKFGALNCALIGLGRKMLSLLLSFLLYGHTLNAFQTVGLTLSLAAMIANFWEKVSSHIRSSAFCIPLASGASAVVVLTAS
jgi:drug/metabolite transporter (DMT)-like permease